MFEDPAPELIEFILDDVEICPTLFCRRSRKSFLDNWGVDRKPLRVGPDREKTVCDLRRVNVFLRLVLFLFTLIIVGAAVALFFVVLFTHPAAQTTGVSLLIFGGVCYVATEFLVSGARLYRYGIEEALTFDKHFTQAGFKKLP